MRAQWNERENEALLTVPWRARVVYLQGLRWHMDFRTGMVGKAYTMSYQKLAEVLDCTEATSTKPDPRVNKEGLRSIFRMLERAGLVEWVRSESKGLVFRCLLADTQQSVQNKDNPKTTPRQPQIDNPEITSNGAACSEIDNPKTTPCCTCEDNPPQVSVYLEEEESSPLPPPSQKKSEWVPPDWLNISAWAEFEQHRREIRQPLSALSRAKAANRLKGLDHAAQQATVDRTIENRWKGLFPEKTHGTDSDSGRGGRRDDKQERLRRINLQLIQGAKQHFE